MGKNHGELNNQLEERRRWSGVTQAALADKVGVSRKSINSIENMIIVDIIVFLFLVIVYVVIIITIVSKRFYVHCGTRL